MHGNRKVWRVSEVRLHQKANASWQQNSFFDLTAILIVKG
jgi:hypothetical protein